jgi:hypothetical protein
MRYNSTFFNLLILVAAILLNGCANRQMPNGGPVDITTPEIISIYPDSSHLRNFDGDHIKIEFDRYVDELSFKESIFISPNVGELEFDWSGSEVLITFSEKLRKNTTYVVNIGTDVKDRFINGAQMARAFTLAFATGPDLDRGGVEGLIFPIKDGDPVNGIMLFAYKLDGINPDTLNPRTSKPDYITQSGKKGDFFLHHIPFGDYRILAIKDEYRNLIYDQEIDEYSVPSSVIRLNAKDTLSSGVLMKLAREDTTRPRLIKLTSLDRNHILAEFSESLNTSKVGTSSFVISDTIKQEALNLETVYPSSSIPNVFVAITQNQDSGKAYRVIVKNVIDSVGNEISPLANSLVFEGMKKVDTLGVRLLQISIKDSMQNIALQPTFSIAFSDAVTKSTSLDWIYLLDKDKQKVPSKKKWLSDISISIVPEKELASKSWYSLRTELREVKDRRGQVCRDSTKTWHFETLDLEDLSSVEGIVSDSNNADIAGRIYVIAKNVGGKSANKYTTIADSSGKFIFPQVAEGQYVLQAFRDRNGNGDYDYGKPFPFSYSERMSPLSDVMKVRARWPLEGVIIKMK